MIQSPVIAAHYQREFERLYSDAILGVPPAIEKKAAAAKQCPPSAKPQGEEAIDDPELTATAPLQPTSSNSQHRRKVLEPASQPQANPELTFTSPSPSADLPSSPAPASTQPDSKTAKPGKPPAKRHSRRPKKQPAQPEAVSAEADSSQTVSPPATSSPSQPLNLNTASEVEIDALPGVSSSLAKRIIAARQQKPFASLADLDHIPGVGPKLLKKLENKVTW